MGNKHPQRRHDGFRVGRSPSRAGWDSSPPIPLAMPACLDNGHSRSIASAVLLATLLLCPPAFGQDTRGAAWAAEQTQKAAAAQPYAPGAIEEWLSTFRKKLLQQPSGLYPYFASVYSGGGFTLGAGYRQYYGDQTHWDVKGLYSLSGYKLLELSTDGWGYASGRMDVHGRVGWRDATQVGYYGLGIDSPSEGSNFRMKQAFVAADLHARPAYPVVLGAGIAYEDYVLEEGRGSSPSIEDIFTPETAPGLGANPAYVHSTASAGVDWRPASGYARRGGLYQIAYHNWADQGGPYDFDRIDATLVQHVPILRETWVVSMRGALQTTLDDADQVPYFLLPSLGSGSTLRGYSSWRFRDRHSLLVSGELRWIPNRLGLDMALFYDAGKVTPRWDDLSLKHMKSDFGIGARFHTPLATPLRIELAKGSEGFNLVFAGSASF